MIKKNILLRCCLTIFLVLLAELFTNPAFAEQVEAEEDKILNAMISSFDVPLGDLVKKEHEDEWRNLFNGLSGNFAVDFPLTQSAVQPDKGQGNQGERTSTNITLQASIKYNPLSYWYANATFYYYLDENLKASFNPDFSYSFGYDDWHPYTFSLVYSNYGGNRLNPDKQKGESFTTFEEGTIALGWKFLIPEEVEDLFLIDRDAHIGCSFNLNLTPRYVDIKSNSHKEWKHSLSLGCKYPIYDWLYINGTAYFYPDKDQQQPFDPDFTYGFGYFDWHPGTISLQYNNYAGNRYPWRKQKDAGTFMNGSITLSWSWAF